MNNIENEKQTQTEHYIMWGMFYYLNLRRMKLKSGGLHFLSTSTCILLLRNYWMVSANDGSIKSNTPDMSCNDS